MIKPTDLGFDPDDILTPERRARIKQLVDDRLLPARWSQILTGEKRPEAPDLADLVGVYDNVRYHLSYPMLSRLLVGYVEYVEGGLDEWMLDEILDAFEADGGFFYGLQPDKPLTLTAA